MKTDSTKTSGQQVKAEQIRKACIKAARKGFMDASISGLCAEGAMEAAISAIQSLDLEQVLNSPPSSQP